MIRLQCKCVIDITLPNCITLLTGKTIEIECPNDRGHGFRRITKTIKSREVLVRRDTIASDQCNSKDSEGLFPPF